MIPDLLRERGRPTSTTLAVICIIGATGIHKSVFNDSWVVGFWRADHGGNGDRAREGPRSPCSLPSTRAKRTRRSAAGLLLVIDIGQRLPLASFTMKHAPNAPLSSNVQGAGKWCSGIIYHRPLSASRVIAAYVGRLN
jgi:hypothetical protein